MLMRWAEGTPSFLSFLYLYSFICIFFSVSFSVFHFFPWVLALTVVVYFQTHCSFCLDLVIFPSLPRDPLPTLHSPAGCLALLQKSSWSMKGPAGIICASPRLIIMLYSLISSSLACFPQWTVNKLKAGTTSYSLNLQHHRLCPQIVSTC